MKRRSFLRKLGAGLAGLAIASIPTSCAQKPKKLEELTQANRELREFPTQLPGAKSIQKYEIPDAKYALVHVRQYHDVANMSEELKEQVLACQGNIYKILEQLVKEKGIDHVYVEAKSQMEGLTSSQKDLRERVEEANKLELELLKRRIKSAEDDIKNPGIIWEDISTEQYIERKKQERDSLYTQLREKEKKYQQDNEKQAQNDLLRGATRKLALEGKITEIPAERTEENLIAGIVMKEFKKGNVREDFTDRIMEDREDMGLYIFSAVEDELKGDLPIVVYGAAHAWGGKNSCGHNYRLNQIADSNKDNILAWNKAHPDKKYSLIEITPEGVK